MPAIANFAVWIEVNRERLPEYKVELSADGTEATCYIPSETGKSFDICYSDSIGLIATSMRADVDGVHVPNGKILHPRDPRTRLPNVVKMRGISTSDTSYRPFVFSNCELVEDEGSATNLSPRIGTIRCVVKHVQVHAGYAVRPQALELPPLQVHERAKKGIVHGIQLGKDVIRVQSPARHTTKLGRIATFKFKYRPMAVLTADNIAPSDKAKAPKARSNASEVIDLTLDNDEGNEKTIRRNKNSDRDRGLDVRVKTEVKKERSQTLLDVIDLTI